MKSSIAHAQALAIVLVCLGPLAGLLAGDDDADGGIQLLSGSAKSELSISEPTAERQANVDEDAAMPADEADQPAASADDPAVAEPGVLDAEAHGAADEPEALDEANPNRVITPTPIGEADESQSEDDANPMATRLHPAALKTPLAAMTFRGVQPGVSTKKELVEACGPPAEVGKSHGVVTYNYRPKDDWRMQVTLNDGIVTAIVLQSAEPRDPAAVTKVLGLDKVSSIEVADDDGKILGEAFPERGVLFGYAQGSDPRRVSQVILEPLDAQTFLLRAEAELDFEFARCLADANAALELDPKSAAANAMRARVYRQAGDLVAALQAAEAAVDAEPAEAEWHLVLAKILVQLSDFDRAKEQLHAVLSSKSSDPLAQAGAHLLTGDVLALSSTQDHAGAVKEHQEAIRLAKTLSDDPKARRRRKAAELMIDAHLHAAYSIGWGYFQHRAEAVEKWLSGAQAVANSLEEQGVLRPELQLRINEQALAALAGLPKPPDPTRWEEAALEQAKTLVQDTDDPIRARDRMAAGAGPVRRDADRADPPGLRSGAQLRPAGRPAFAAGRRHRPPIARPRLSGRVAVLSAGSDPRHRPQGPQTSPGLLRTGGQVVGSAGPAQPRRRSRAARRDVREHRGFVLGDRRSRRGHPAHQARGETDGTGRR